MAKNKKISVIAVLSAVVILAAVCFIFREKLYPFSYVKGTITVTIDGQPAEVTLAAQPDKTKVKISDNTVEIKTKAGEYGSYTYTVKAGDMNADLEIMHANWYEATKFDLVIDYHTDSDGMIYTLNAKTGGDTETRNDFIVNGGKIRHGSV